jgi:5'-deoxynucleotidase YfbR-like HD superfamily hydrolase
MSTAVVHRGSENGNRYSPSGREVLTRSGVMIDVTAPRSDQIRLADIAVSLAHQERFTGHCPLRPTVAQHSLAVEWLAGELFDRQLRSAVDPLEDRLLLEQRCRQEALMHDAPEFLVSDLNGAVKKDIRPRLGSALLLAARTESRFDELETLAEHAIWARFGLTHDWGAIVHEADVLACAYEMAWGGWCADAHPPAWVRDSLAVKQCYGWPDGGRPPGDDGGEAAFLARAEFLGIR